MNAGRMWYLVVRKLFFLFRIIREFAILRERRSREVITRGFYTVFFKGSQLLTASFRAILNRVRVTSDPCGNEKMPIIEEYCVVKRGKCNGAQISLSVRYLASVICDVVVHYKGEIISKRSTFFPIVYSTECEKGFSFIYVCSITAVLAPTQDYGVEEDKREGENCFRW